MAFGPSLENALGPAEREQTSGESEGYPVRGDCCPEEGFFEVEWLDSADDPAAGMASADRYRLRFQPAEPWRDPADGDCMLKWSEVFVDTTTIPEVITWVDRSQVVAFVDGTVFYSSSRLKPADPAPPLHIFNGIGGTPEVFAPGVVVVPTIQGEISDDGVSWVEFLPQPSSRRPQDYRRLFAETGLTGARYLRVTVLSPSLKSYLTPLAGDFPITISYTYRETDAAGVIITEVPQSIVWDLAVSGSNVFEVGPPAGVGRASVFDFVTDFDVRLAVPLAISSNVCLEA